MCIPMVAETDDIVLPLVDKQLIDRLEQQFPSKPPRSGESFADLMVRAGHAEIIQFLREQWARQTDPQE